jgi:AcrR family transcriptional regulator
MKNDLLCWLMFKRMALMAKKDTSQKILSAAFKCISEKGCATVNLREIAEEAGVVLSQLNYYFTNKETLFAEVLRKMRQDYVTHVETQMAQCTSTAEKIDVLIEYNRHLLHTNQALYRSFLDFFNLALWSNSFRDEMNQFLNEIAAVIEHNLGDQGAEMQKGRYSSSTQARMILGSSFGIAMQHLMDPENDDILQCFEILHMLSQTFRPEEI